MPLRSITLLIVIALTLIPAAPLLHGQAISGDLTGTVLDATGAAIPNAKVDAVNTATNVTQSTVTNANGEYRLSNLQPGTYTIQVNAQGFAAGQLRNVQVNLNQIATANVTLQVGQTTTTVEVAEAGAVIDTTTAQVQTTFGSQQAELASFGSGVNNLALLSAGVASSGGVGVG